MTFRGVVEQVSRERVSGWVVNPAAPDMLPNLTLRFQSGESMPPSSHPSRQGAFGFAFELPVSYAAMSWDEFVNDFDGVYVRSSGDDSPEVRMPLFKSVLFSAGAANRTALLASRLKAYALTPPVGGRLAVLTVVDHDRDLMQLWARHYSSLVSGQDIYVIDLRPDCGALGTPPEITVVPLPHDLHGNWQRVRVAGMMQRLLLESYESVLFASQDDLICVAPDFLSGGSFAQYMLSLPQPVATARGYALIHDVEAEPSYDPARPLLDQRRLIHRDPALDKPLVARVPLNWTPGFHSAAEGGVAAPAFYLINLRWFDLDYTLRRAERYRRTRWDQHDLDNQMGVHERIDEVSLVSALRGLATPFRGIEPAIFNPNLDDTVVPEWMRASLTI